MKFKAVLLVLITFFTYQLNAQSVKISMAPELNFPTGNASNVSGIGFGAAVKAEIGIATKYAITANGGYTMFVGKKYFGNRIPNIEAVPVKLGFKYYSTPEFYMEAQAGQAFRQDNAAKNSFVWSAGFGTYLKTNGVGKLDFGLRYEAWSNDSFVNNATSNTTQKKTSFGFIGLRLGYSFGL